MRRFPECLQESCHSYVAVWPSSTSCGMAARTDAGGKRSEERRKLLEPVAALGLVARSRTGACRTSGSLILLNVCSQSVD